MHAFVAFVLLAGLASLACAQGSGSANILMWIPHFGKRQPPSTISSPAGTCHVFTNHSDVLLADMVVFSWRDDVPAELPPMPRPDHVHWVCVCCMIEFGSEKILIILCFRFI